MLIVFESKVLRNIFGPERIGDDFRIRFNSEMYELLNDIGVVQSGYIVRMMEDASARRVFDSVIYLSPQRERPCIRWKDQIEEILSSIGIINTQEAEAPERMCCSRPNSINRFVMPN